MTNPEEVLEHLRQQDLIQVQHRASFNMEYTRHVLELVRHERFRQVKLGREGRIPHACESPHTDQAYSIGVLGEEFGEVCKVVIEDNDSALLQQELVQVAAVAVAWAEAIQREQRELMNRGPGPDTEEQKELRLDMSRIDQGVDADTVRFSIPNIRNVDEQEHAAVLQKALAKYQERSGEYGQVWKSYGLKGCMQHLRTCLERAWVQVWRTRKDPTDNLIDGINYSVFAIRSLRMDSEGTWDYGD